MNDEGIVAVLEEAPVVSDQFYRKWIIPRSSEYDASAVAHKIIAGVQCNERRGVRLDWCLVQSDSSETSKIESVCGMGIGSDEADRNGLNFTSDIDSDTPDARDVDCYPVCDRLGCLDFCLEEDGVTEVSANLARWTRRICEAPVVGCWWCLLIQDWEGYVDPDDEDVKQQYEVDGDAQITEVAIRLFPVITAQVRSDSFILKYSPNMLLAVSDARRIFAKAKEIAKTKPATVTTDGMQSYGIAFKKEFYTMKAPRTEWIRSAGIRSARTNNNIVERLNGTVRERNKVQRGWKKQDTPLAEGQRIYYNHLRPHQALEGKTPAQAAGIGLDRRSWIEIIKASAQGE